VNISSHDLYTPDENGTYSWFNPLGASSNTDAKKTGLDEQDLQDRGAYVYHRSATTSIYPAKLSSSITKTTGTIVYDKINSKADVPFTITAYESFGMVTLSEDVYQQWATDSGTFYDLLPQGYHFDASKTVTVTEAGYNAHEATLESCTVVSDDYLGSGRQLLCFKVKSAREPGKNYNKTSWASEAYSTGFKITFTASITNDDIALYGAGYNVVTYQRGDQREIADGYADDGHGRYDQRFFPVGKNGEYLLKGVNGTGEMKNTLFAYSYVNPEPLPTVQTGIRKTVRANSSTFVQDDISDLGQNYTYKVVIETSKDGYTSDIIMYDVLECAKNRIGWKGEFVSVNCSAAIQRGIDVKVYYSSDDLNYSDEDPLTLYDADGNLNPHWQLLTDDTPGKDVKALAFDMRYLTTGEPLVLDTQSVLGFEVTMKAPDELQSVEYAYNQPAYFCKYQGKGSDTIYEKLTVGNVTSVNLRDLQDIVFRKACDADDGSKKALGGVKFALYKCENTDPDHQHTSYPGNSNSCWGQQIATTSSLADGTVTFSNLDSGAYAIRETNAPTGFQTVYSAYWVFTVDAKNGTISDPSAYASGSSQAEPMELIDGLWTLTNKRMVHSLDLRKTWEDNKNKLLIRPSTLTFDLYRNGELYQTKTVTVSKSYAVDSFSKLFKDIYDYDEYGNRYTYEVRERVPDGYVALNDGVINASTYSMKMTNTGLGVLEIKKTVVGSDTTEAFGFTLTLKNADGTAYVPVDADGNAAAVVAHRYTTDVSVYTRETLVPDAQGCVHVTVASGETVQLLGLPYGTTWTVDEDANEYTVVSDPTPAAGNISEDAISTVTFTNTVKPAELTLDVHKVVTGSAASSVPFTFEIAAVTQDAPMPASATVTVNGAGTVSFAPISYIHTGTYVYRVTEVAGNVGGYQYDSTAYEVTVTVTDENGQLTAVWTAKNGEAEADQLVFTNTYHATGSLTLTAYKTVNGATPTDLQVFDFELTSGADTPAVSQTKQNTGKTVVFDRIDYTEADVGKIYNYTVKETTADGNGMTVDTTVYNVHVLVEDNGDGTLKLTATADDGQNAVTYLTFDNTYEATGKLSLSAKKTVNGKEPKADQQYTFELTSGAGTPALTQTKVNNLGIVTFDDIAYTLADAGKTYQYTVRETTQDSEGLTADKTVYTVTVTIVDNGNGTLTVTPVYSHGEETVQEMTFDNKLTGSIVLSKQVEGDLSDEEFTFKVTFADEDGTLLTEAFAYTGSKSGVVGNGDTLTLKAGECIIIDGVPVDTVCSITEESSVRYTTTVNAENADSICFAVTTEATPVTFVNTLVTTEFTVTKEWQGSDGGG
jgi:pilin isopeptide linkage protein